MRPLALGVETMLFSMHFSVVTVAPGTLRFPSKDNKFPSLFLCGSILHTILPYVVFDVLNGTSDFGTKHIVLFPLMRLSTPCASLPNSLANDYSHMDLSGPLMSCLYSRL